MEADNSDDAVGKAFRVVSDSIPDGMEELWVGTEWMVGVQRVSELPSDKVFFRKFQKRRGTQIYVTSWSV